MLTAEKVLAQYFLDTRCHLLEIAAMLDRYDVASDRTDAARPDADGGLEKIYGALEILAERQTSGGRAERILRLFSEIEE